MNPLVVANWKMNPQTLTEAKELFDSVVKGVGSVENAEVVICPPFVYLSALGASAQAEAWAGLRLGSQNCFWEEKGAYTGEVSPKMLRDLECEYVIIGHSERRIIFGETNEMISKKIKAALKMGLKVILCIGETAQEKEEGKMNSVLEKQLREGLSGFENWKLGIENFIVAYEPVWAIGSGDACSVREAGKILAFLRVMLRDNPILYGGSVNSSNSSSYIREAGFNGLLVGGASLFAEEFVKIVKSIS